ncbi:hypothetical protein F6X56_02215 (plasmid) [Rhodococcus erythropolis]|uniref:Uncharacterized protein n=1 Tax=Rhodococcus qingshengii JCM 15477 TaxID=1303681 RepID=A0AB38RP56_RHOSG|nr:MULTISPECIES: hypothetical protein [Rhodococcus]MBY6388691.1 hypothetical protein [Rhodococcus erythropolis]MBY6388973.1 hypothetical protein [Rhodococcus erythropolis]MBY6389106.1 hypothetical protein [Rhodococcus erythropolis]MBY6389586.1 hypothetical protein [Rhodococcus erythropolis]MBY6389610.1 hypothetical protein [Rhodococcus erythropolis]
MVPHTTPGLVTIRRWRVYITFEFGGFVHTAVWERTPAGVKLTGTVVVGPTTKCGVRAANGPYLESSDVSLGKVGRSAASHR